MHIPVLLEEVIEWLKLADAGKFIDATLDGGGHTLAALKRFPDIRVLGIEFDPVEFKQFSEQRTADSRLIAVNRSYTDIRELAKEYDFYPDAVLFDLGVSSWHYEASGRGFSFQKDEVLDMRFNPQVQSRTAADLVNLESEQELERILAEYGEEQFSKEIARGIVEARRTSPVLTTDSLVHAVLSAVPNWYRKRKIHPATKTFQALRMAVNDELGSIRTGLLAAIDVLKLGGRLAVISFHGLEDSTVREVFQEKTKEGTVKWVTKRTIRPAWQEIKANPRSRSAKMKICEKISNQ